MRGPIDRLRERSAAHIGGATNRLGLALLVVALCSYFQARSSNFLSEGNIIAILVDVSSILLAAMAAGRLLIAGNVDLSIGGMFAMLNVLCALVARGSGSLLLAIVVTLGAGLALGAVNGYLVRVLRISPIIVTLGLASVYTGAAFAMSGDQTVFPIPQSLTNLSNTKFAGVPDTVWIPLIVFAIGGFVLTRTVGGLRSYAIGGDVSASKLVGLKVDRHVLQLFIYMGGSMGLVALLSVGQLGAGSASTGTDFELEVLTAVVLGGVGFAGGTGRPIGIFVGVILIGVLDSGLVFIGIADYWQQVARGAALLAALGADQYIARQRRGRIGAARQTLVRDFVTDRNSTAPPGAALGEIALSANGLVKAYGAVTAVNDVSFSVRSGEVLCLVGDNGAGKSSVIKMLSGALRADSGSISISGKAVDFASPIDARRSGVETVFQDLALCPNLGAAYNMVLGEEPTRRGGFLRLFDRTASVRIARERLEMLGVDLDSYLRPVSLLSGGQRQSISIARVVKDGVRVVILDEPTAALGVNQTQGVLRLTRTLAEAGAAVIMITHDVDSILRVADRVVVLNLGRVITDTGAGGLDGPRLVHLMAGIIPADLSPDVGPNDELDSPAVSTPVGAGHGVGAGQSRPSSDGAP
jgi:ribose/xylose/arabinose/galactoside ABC-type transport system permease subunit/ABC-type branched-subunit amino acid transport system ATPase component